MFVYVHHVISYLFNFKFEFYFFLFEKNKIVESS